MGTVNSQRFFVVIRQLHFITQKLQCQDNLFVSVREVCLMGTDIRIKPERLSEKLKYIRQNLGFTLEMMAEKLKTEKINLYRGTIHNYESGDREPPLPVLLQYARLANIYVEFLIDDELELPNKLPATDKRFFN